MDADCFAASTRPGVVARVPGSSTSMRSATCSTVRRNAAAWTYLWLSTPRWTFGGNRGPTRDARRAAPCSACIGPPFWTTRQSRWPPHSLSVSSRGSWVGRLPKERRPARPPASSRSPCRFFRVLVTRRMGLVSRYGQFIDSTVDGFVEVAVLLALAYYMRGHLWGPQAAAAALAGSLLVSYTRARGESVGVVCTGGLMPRAVRLVLTLGAGLFDRWISKLCGAPSGCPLVLGPVI